MLTQDFKSNIQNPSSPLNGGIAPNQPMSDEQFNQWANPAPEKIASHYSTAMGITKEDGTPNTDKGILAQSFDQFKKGYEQTKEGVKNPDILAGMGKIGEGALNEMGAGIRTVFSPIEAAFKVGSQLPVVKQALDATKKYIIDPMSEPIANSKALQDFMQKYPNADEVAQNLIAIGLTFMGGGKSGEVKSVLEKSANDLTSKTSELTGKMGNKLNETFTPTPKSPAEIQAGLEQSAIKDTTPSYNKNLIGEKGIPELDAQGNPTGKINPRVSEGKGLKMRTVNSTPEEIAAGKELSRVEGYKPGDTSLNKYNTVANDIIKKSETYRASLANEKVVIPKKEMVSLVKRTVNETSQNSLLLQKTDPIVKNYIRVAQRAAEKVDGTLAGEDALRLALDKAYEDAGGKYGNNKGLDQIHRATRDAITQDMEIKAQTTQVKASLKQMRDLYKANDILKDKAQAEGGSAWEQFKKAHPIITNTIKAGARAAGVGEAVHLGI